ncbi:MAG: hypothetical protein JWO03_2920 [Bacteroidetes bacterium]|nr:hypothetical protein [Bacteroidota bacterium]
MARKLLIAVLLLSLIVELGLAGGLFFARDLMGKMFGLAVSGDTALFLAYIVGWLCLFVSLVIGLALYQLVNNNPNYATLCYLMGYFWIAIGIAIFVAFHKPDNLIIDTLKGMLIVGLTMVHQRVAPIGRRR